MRLQTQELVPQPVRAYTTDSARRPARDTLLKAEAMLKNPAMLGRTWVGNLTSLLGELNSMSTSDRAIVVDEVQRGLASYAQGLHGGTTLRASNFGSFGTGAEEVFDVGAGADPEDLNAANKAFWDRANRSVTRDVVPPRGGIGPVSIEEIQRANDAFWKRQTAHQRTAPKQWGKG